MQKNMLNFFKLLLSTPSPSGFETQVAAIYRNELSPLVDDIQTDVMGNVIAVLNPDAPFRVMIAGHLDEIGFQITALNSDGLLSFRAAGGINKLTLPGTFVDILLESGGVVKGFIASKPLHFMDSTEQSKAVEIKNLWIDVGVQSKEALESLGIMVGDPVAVRANVEEMGEYRIVSKGMDDKVGAFITAEVMRLLAKEKSQLKVAVYGVGTVQEELGLRGAKVATSRINPHVGFCIDVGFTSDTPDIDRKLIGDCSLGNGPILVRNADNNPVLAKRIKSIATAHQLSYQISAGRMSSGGNDTSMMQLNGNGTATALFSIPSRYMHSPVEMVDLRDIESTIQIIAQTILSIDPTEQFRPGID